MSDPQENDESKPLSDWTLVDSQGEIMSGDGDSESSDSSIEVVSVEGNEVVSCRLRGGRNLEQETVVVTENTPSAYPASEEISALEGIEAKHEEKTASSDTGSRGQPVNLAGIDPCFTSNTTVKSSKKEVTSFEGATNSLELLRNKEEVEDVQNVVLREDETKAQSANNIHTSVTADLALNADESGLGQVLHGNDEDVAIDDEKITNIKKNRKLVSTDNSTILSHSCGELNIETSQRDETYKVEQGACCMELLKRSSSNGADGSETSILHAGDVGERGCPSPTPVSFEETEVLQMSGDGATHSSIGSRSDSDTDSDFVRLDSESIGNIDAFVEEHEGSEERVVIPLKLYRTGSSIGPSFNFIRNEGFGDDADEDQDDDTESSTEEGVDDRIESEQSEAGSLSAQNDVGDLSVFADIGDLPLEAGDVPRNYIHRPNNHLSTVLNIIVVLAAILTMGISLGIIMATDLEIEEWQNAYEVQTKRVNELETKLQWKTEELRRAQELTKDYNRELSYAQELKVVKSQLLEMETIAMGYENALHSVAVDSFSKDGKFENVLQRVKLAVKGYNKCKEDPSQTTELCAAELHPYAKMYSVLIDDSVFGHCDEVCCQININKEKFARYISEKYDEELEEPEHLAEKEMMTSTPSEHQRQPALNNKLEAPEKAQASPVDLDIRQLQQSLTREQERALHWQQLYLMERRQREKERENEEWEDEREREMWEREKERMDELECLKKLMSANVTTLTQHVTKWNVSVFDDFANLSMLMSGVAELKQSVVDSVNRVWENAEELIDKMQAKEEKQEGTKREESIPKQEKLIEYLKLYLDLVKSNFMPDKEILIEHFSRMLDDVKHGAGHLGRILDDIKHGVTDVFSEVNHESIINSLRKIWEDPEEVVKALNGKGMSYEERGTISSSDKEIIINYLMEILNNIQDRLGDVVDEAHSREDETETEPTEQNGVREDTEMSPDGKNNKDDDHNIPPSNNDAYFEEEDSTKGGFWSKKLGKALKKTSKVVRKFGRKIANTWGKVKTIWREKKPFIFDAAKRFTSKFSKFSKIGMKWQRKWFKAGKQEFDECTDIHSKCVYKARKEWQHQVLHDPCEALGKFSFECNSGRKKCKKDLKEMSRLFSQLLSIPNMEPSQISTWSQKDVELIRDQFELFQQQWGNSKLLLKTDVEWVACQATWWSSAARAIHARNVDMLESNHCDTIQLEDNFCDGHCNGVHDQDDRKYSAPHEKHNDDDDKDHDHEERNSAFVDDDVEEDDKEKDDHHDDKEHDRNYILDDDYDQIEGNETAEDQDSADWYLERARYRLQSRREKEKADWLFEMAADREQQRNEQLNEKFSQKDEQHWVFKKAEERERQRVEDHRSDWLFERADDRRTSFTRKWIEGSETDNNHPEDNGDRKRTEESGRWFTDRAEERQKKRDEKHQSDWVFERAADRRKDHNQRHHSKSKKHHHSKEGDEKHFRHAHGKASGHGKFRHTYGRVVSTP